MQKTEELTASQVFQAQVQSAAKQLAVEYHKVSTEYSAVLDFWRKVCETCPAFLLSAIMFAKPNEAVLTHSQKGYVCLVKFIFNI